MAVYNIAMTIDNMIGMKLVIYSISRILFT